MSRPRLLDLFCGAGGASMGYHRAGFDVVGVDINPQKNYPFEFIQADAMEYPLDGFDYVHASPPCQRFTLAQKLQGKAHVDLLAPTRKRLISHGAAYVIENVVGAPMVNPVLMCGHTFNLGTYRHRLFEASKPVQVPRHLPHDKPTAKMGRPPLRGQMMHVVGNFSGVQRAREAMGIDWMCRDELSQAIPPAYTEFIGRQLLRNGV